MAGCGIWLYQFLIIAYPFTIQVCIKWRDQFSGESTFIQTDFRYPITPKYKNMSDKLVSQIEITTSDLVF